MVKNEEKNNLCLQNIVCEDNKLLNRCFYIQSCNITECENTFVNSSIIAYLSFTGIDECTDTYYVSYYFINPVIPPYPIPGVANKINGTNKNIQCLFNDGSVFTINFSTDKYDIGTINMLTPKVTGFFCIVGTSLYTTLYACGNCFEQQKIITATLDPNVKS